MEINTLIISKKNNSEDITLEFILDVNDVNSIIEKRYKTIPHKIIKLSDLPVNFLEFQSAFDVLCWSPLKFWVKDFSKAKEIWLEHYRRARTPLLEKLDIEFMRAVEVGDTTLQKEIAAKKQALRDVTKTELPDTLEGIKATWPEILGKNPFNS